MAELVAFADGESQSQRRVGEWRRVAEQESCGEVKDGLESKSRAVK
jgi:hypothetical protein